MQLVGAVRSTGVFCFDCQFFNAVKRVFRDVSEDIIFIGRDLVPFGGVLDGRQPFDVGRGRNLSLQIARAVVLRL